MSSVFKTLANFATGKGSGASSSSAAMGGGHGGQAGLGFAPVLAVLLEDAVKGRQQALRDAIVQCQMAGCEGPEEVVDILTLASEGLVGSVSVTARDIGGTSSSSAGAANSSASPRPANAHPSGPPPQAFAAYLHSSNPTMALRILQVLVAEVGRMCSRNVMPLSRVDQAVQILWKAYALSEFGLPQGSHGHNIGGGAGGGSGGGGSSSSSHHHGGGSSSAGTIMSATALHEMQQRTVQAVVGLVNVTVVGSSQLQNALSLAFHLALQSQSVVVAAAASAAIAQATQNVLRNLLLEDDSQQHAAVQAQTPLRGTGAAAGAAAGALSSSPVEGGNSPVESLAPTGPSTLFGGGSASTGRLPSLPARHMQAVLLFKDVCAMIAGAQAPRWVALTNPMTAVAVMPTVGLRLLLLEAVGDLLDEAWTRYRPLILAAHDYHNHSPSAGADALHSPLGAEDRRMAPPPGLSAAALESAQQAAAARPAGPSRSRASIGGAGPSSSVVAIAPLFSQCLNEDFTALVLNADASLGLERFSRIHQLAVSAVVRFHDLMTHAVNAIINRHCAIINECGTDEGAAKWPMTALIAAWRRALGDPATTRRLLMLSREKLTFSIASTDASSPAAATGAAFRLTSPMSTAGPGAVALSSFTPPQHTPTSPSGPSGGFHVSAEDAAVEAEDEASGARALRIDVAAADVRAYSPAVSLITSVAALLQSEQSRAQVNTEVALEFIATVSESLSRVAETLGGAGHRDAEHIRRVVLLIGPSILVTAQAAVAEAVARWQRQQADHLRRLVSEDSGGGERDASSPGGSGGGGVQQPVFAAPTDDEELLAAVRCASYMVRCACAARLPGLRHAFLRLLHDAVASESATWLSAPRQVGSLAVQSPPSRSAGGQATLPTGTSHSGTSASPERVYGLGTQHRIRATPLSALAAVFGAVVSLAGGVGGSFGASWPLVARVFVHLSVLSTTPASVIEADGARAAGGREVADILADLEALATGVADMFRAAALDATAALQQRSAQSHGVCVPLDGAALASTASSGDFAQRAQASMAGAGASLDSRHSAQSTHSRLSERRANGASTSQSQPHTSQRVPVVVTMAGALTRCILQFVRDGAVLVAADVAQLESRHPQPSGVPLAELPDVSRHATLAHLRAAIAFGRRCLLTALSDAAATVAIGALMAGSTDGSTALSTSGASGAEAALADLWDRHLVALALDPFVLARRALVGSGDVEGEGPADNHGPPSPAPSPLLRADTDISFESPPQGHQQQQSAALRPPLSPESLYIASAVEAALLRDVGSGAVPVAAPGDVAGRALTVLFAQYASADPGPLVEMLMQLLTHKSTAPVSTTDAGGNGPSDGGDDDDQRSALARLALRRRALQLLHDLYSAASLASIPPAPVASASGPRSGGGPLAPASHPWLGRPLTGTEGSMLAAVLQGTAVRTHAILRLVQRALQTSFADTLQQDEWVQVVRLLTDAAGGVPSNPSLFGGGASSADGPTPRGNASSTVVGSLAEGEAAADWATCSHVIPETDRWRLIVPHVCGHRGVVLRGLVVLQQQHHAQNTAAKAGTSTSTPNAVHPPTPEALRLSTADDAALAFRCVESLLQNSVTAFRTCDALRAVIGCAGAFIVQCAFDKLSVNLSAVQLLWSLADFLATLQSEQQQERRQSTSGFLGADSSQGDGLGSTLRAGSDASLSPSFASSASSAGGATGEGSPTGEHTAAATAAGFAPETHTGSTSFTGHRSGSTGPSGAGGAAGRRTSSRMWGLYPSARPLGLSTDELAVLWTAVVLQLRRGCLDLRPEVRQSSIKSFFALMTTHGRTSLQPVVWNVCCWGVVAKLAAIGGGSLADPRAFTRALVTPAATTTGAAATSHSGTPAKEHSPDEVALGVLETAGSGRRRTVVCLQLPQSRVAEVTPAVHAAHTAELHATLRQAPKALHELRASVLDSTCRILLLYGSFLLSPIHVDRRSHTGPAPQPTTTGSATIPHTASTPGGRVTKTPSGAAAASVRPVTLPVDALPEFIGVVLRFAEHCIQGVSDAPEDLVAAAVRILLAILREFWAVPMTHVLAADRLPVSVDALKQLPGPQQQFYVLYSSDISDAWACLGAAVGHAQATPAILTTLVEGLRGLVAAARGRWDARQQAALVAPDDFQGQLLLQTPPYATYFELLEAVLRSPGVVASYYFPCKPQTAVIEALLHHVVPASSATKGQPPTIVVGPSPTAPAPAESERQTAMTVLIDVLPTLAQLTDLLEFTVEAAGPGQLDKARVREMLPPGSHHPSFLLYLVDALVNRACPALLETLPEHPVAGAVLVGTTTAPEQLCFGLWCCGTVLRATGAAVVAITAMAAVLQRRGCSNALGFTADAAAALATHFADLCAVMGAHSHRSVGQEAITAIAETLEYAASQLRLCSHIFDEPSVTAPAALQPLKRLLAMAEASLSQTAHPMSGTSVPNASAASVSANDNKGESATATQLRVCLRRRLIAAVSTLSAFHEAGLRETVDAACAILKGLEDDVPTPTPTPSATATPHRHHKDPTTGASLPPTHKATDRDEAAAAHPAAAAGSREAQKALLDRLASVASGDHSGPDRTFLITGALNSASAAIGDVEVARETFPSWGGPVLGLIAHPDDGVRAAVQGLLRRVLL